jgi:intergrase/recombinase
LWVSQQNFCSQYKRDLINKIPLIFQKHTYTFDELKEHLQKSISKIKEKRYTVILVSLLLKYLIEELKVPEITLLPIRKTLKFSKPITPDTYVPTDDEMKQTLSKLSDKVQLVYIVYLVSGMRKVEGSYLLDNVSSLKVQQFESFVKISMNYLRKTKNSYFCYLPLEVYSKLSANHKQLSVSSLEQEIKRKKLIPIKYCRKWFYTKCIEIGVPESIADYYQGRVSNSVGGNHYLSRQMLADKNYTKIVSYLKQSYNKYL